MDITHLYDDSHLGNLAIALDVKEQMRTKEINTREERNLEKQSRSYDKAKTICLKNTTWERWQVGQMLRTIWERTPSLGRSLAMEKARVESLRRAALQPATYSHVSLHSSLNIPEPKNTISSPSRPSKHKNGRHNRGCGSQRRNTLEERRPLNTDLSRGRHLQRRADFMRRSQHVVNLLARLNWQQESRRRDHEKFKAKLLEFSKPIIERAKVVLKGRSDMNVEDFVKEFQNYLAANNGCNNSESINSITTTNSQSFEKEGAELIARNALLVQPPEKPNIILPHLFPAQVISHREENDVKFDENTNESHRKGRENIDLNASYNHHKDEERFEYSLKNKEQIHLPPIHVRKVVAATRTARHLGDAISSYNNASVSSSSSNSRSSNMAAKRKPNTYINTSLSLSYTSVSHVILEEDADENNDEENYNFKERFSEVPSKTYKLACTTGLPQVWRQSVVKEKERIPPETLPSIIAKKYTRGNKKS